MFSSRMTFFTIRSWSSVSKITKFELDRQMFSFSPQNAGADRMERAEHDPFDGLVGQKGFDARLPFLWRLYW